MGINKVSQEGTTLIDLSNDTLSVGTLVGGHIGYDSLGNLINGSIQGDCEDDILSRNLSGVYYNDQVTSIRTTCFYRIDNNNGDKDLKIILPNVTTIGTYAFYGCQNLSYVSLPSLTTISNYAFYECSKLSSIDVNPTSVGSYAFQSCANLTSINGSSTTWIGAYAFKDCKKLESIDLPVFVKGNGNPNQAFMNCTSLKKIFWPNITYFYGSEAFRGCTALEGVIFPKFSGNNSSYYFVQSYFYGDTKLKYVDVLNPYSIVASVFYGCTIFDTLIIRGTARTTSLGNVNAFTNTPFASNGTGGKLYVPQSKIADYQAATNWSTLLGYTNNQILPIEGSVYEFQYADFSMIGGFNGTWEVEGNGSITITNNNHVQIYAAKNYGASGFQYITRDNNKPWFYIPPHATLKVISPDQNSGMGPNGGMQLRLQDETNWLYFGQYYSSPIKVNDTDDYIPIYSIGFKKYNQGTMEYDIQIMIDDVRLI